ncbi:hypothetical protein M514_00728 [Trichuris suis]|uniref:Uncharacterized protein n=1 Tax=Trichuris suis TaxID=68888 RepID=A0A085MMQ6_9BILA|nr:hypothetical protein M513_00728 [Trichuris suis]KFD65131.1 hypothetical protein M514_00728 [Trichuris suis]
MSGHSAVVQTAAGSNSGVGILPGDEADAPLTFNGLFLTAGWLTQSGSARREAQKLNAQKFGWKSWAAPLTSVIHSFRAKDHGEWAHTLIEVDSFNNET